MAVNIGPKIGIEGEAEYRKELNNIIQQAKTLDAEMKAVTSSFGKNTTAAKKNAAQADELSKAITLQQQRVKLLGDMVERSTEKTGANSTTTLKWQQALNEANAELSTMQNRLTEMKVPTEEWGRALQDTGEKLKGVGEKMSKIGQTLTTHVTLPLAAAGAAAVAAASDYEENLNKIDVAFEESASYVKAWADTATDSFGLSKNSALEAAALFGDMATSMGFTRQEAAKMSTELAGLAGDLASFKNISTDQAMNALKSVFTGETESLKNLGVVMTQTNLEEFAERQGKVYSSASETEKAFMRYQFVLERTQNAQGDYSNTSDGFANSLRTLKESAENLAIAFGELLLPVVTPIVKSLTGIVKAITNLPGPVKAVLTVIAVVAAVVGPLVLIIGKILIMVGQLATVLPALGGAFGVAAGGAATFTAALGPVLMGLAAVVAAVIGFVALVAGVVLLIDEIDSHKEEIGEFFHAVGEAAVEGVETAGRALDAFKEKAVNTFNNVVAKADEIGNGIRDRFLMMGEGIKHGFEVGRVAAELSFQKLKDNATKTVQEIADNFPVWIDNAKTLGRDIVTGVREGMDERKRELLEKAAEILEAVVEDAKSTWNKAKQWGRDLVDNIASGINGAQNVLQNAANLTAGTISGYLHFSKPDVGPLANIDQWMPDMMNLLASGIMANLGQIEQAANLTANNIYMPISGNEEIAAGLNRMNNTLSEHETPVNVNVTLQGGAEKFFKEVVSVNQRRTMSTGYNQLAMR